MPNLNIFLKSGQYQIECVGGGEGGGRGVGLEKKWTLVWSFFSQLKFWLLLSTLDFGEAIFLKKKTCIKKCININIIKPFKYFIVCKVGIATLQHRIIILEYIPYKM